MAFGADASGFGRRIDFKWFGAPSSSNLRPDGPGQRLRHAHDGLRRDVEPARKLLFRQDAGHGRVRDQQTGPPIRQLAADIGDGISRGEGSEPKGCAGSPPPRWTDARGSTIPPLRESRWAAPPRSKTPPSAISRRRPDHAQGGGGGRRRDPRKHGPAPAVRNGAARVKLCEHHAPCPRSALLLRGATGQQGRRVIFCESTCS